MVQVLYSIAAIMLLGITVLNINVKIHGTEERMMLSELSLEMTSVGAEILNEIARLDYDLDTVGYGDGVQPASGFDDASAFGSGSCDPDNNFSGCFTINNIHGKTATRTISRVFEGTTFDVPYNVTDITVCYADVAPPHDCAASGAKTYAKKVTLNVSTPVLLDPDGNPYEIPMSRVYMYPNF